METLQVEKTTWSVVFQGYGQFKIGRILTKIGYQSCVFIWCHSLLNFFFTFQLQQGQNSTTSEKGAQSKQNDQLLISPWKFLGCRSIMFWPNHFFLPSWQYWLSKFSQKASASNVDELIIFWLILFKSVLCVISYISSSYQTSIARKFKITLKWKWHHKCTEYFFWEIQVFQCQDRWR